MKNKLNFIFNKQIMNKENPQDPIHKMLFNEAYNLTPYDWKMIRIGDYYELKDKMGFIEGKYFTLKKIKEWKKRNK